MAGGFDYYAIDFVGDDAPSLADVRAGKATIKTGTKGDSVKYVQELTGFEDADGDFGSKTETAVRAFQRANKLNADGVVGRDTLAALGKVANGDLARVNYSEGGPASPPARASQAAPSASSPSGAALARPVAGPAATPSAADSGQMSTVAKAGVAGCLALGGGLLLWAVVGGKG